MLQDIILDDEEKELLELFESGQLKSVKSKQKEINKAIEAAKAHMRKDTRINIRISKLDLERIKRVASLEGLPYQTLVASVLHKYASNHLNVSS